MREEHALRRSIWKRGFLYLLFVFLCFTVNVKAGAGDYIISDSDSRYLTDSDVEGLSLQEINYAKNEIFARHGRKFNSAELQSYFEGKSWYTGLYEPADFDANYSANLLNDYEKVNSEFLSAKEHEIDPNGYQLDVQTEATETEAQTAETTVAQAVSSDISAYADVMQEYYYAKNENYTGEEYTYIAPYLSFNGYENEVYYCLYDIAEDGMPELLVSVHIDASEYFDEMYQILGIYSTDGTSIYKVCGDSGYPMETYILCENNIIECTGIRGGMSSGSTTFYRLAPGAATGVAIEGVGHSGAGECFRLSDIDTAEYEEISYKDYEAILASYQSADINAIEWSSLSEYSLDFSTVSIPALPVRASGNVIADSGSRINGKYLIDDNEIPMDSIRSISVLNSLADMPDTAWDVSEKGDGSVMVWTVESDEAMYDDNGEFLCYMKDMYLAGNGGVDAPSDCTYLFAYYHNLRSISFNNSFYTGNATEFYGMFRQDKSLVELDLTSFNTSNVTSLWFMFEGCTSLESINLCNFDTHNVTQMWGVFIDCESLKELDLSSFDTRKVLDMHEMFENCKSLTTLDLSNFDTSNVKTMNYMFSGCSSLTVLDISSFDMTTAEANGNYGRGMFEGTIWE